MTLIKVYDELVNIDACTFLPSSTFRGKYVYVVVYKL